MTYAAARQKLRPVDQAITDLRAIPDPYTRLREAERLDAALATARGVVAQIKQDTIRSLRGPSAGYGTIAQRLGITRARVQQIANAPRKLLLAAYAFHDEGGRWHGQPRLLPSGRYRTAPTSGPFFPADKYNPLSGQTLTVRYGEINDEREATAYTVQVRKDDGSLLNLRMTHQVQDALFGPPIMGAPERKRWEEAREQRRRELEAG